MVQFTRRPPESLTLQYVPGNRARRFFEPKPFHICYPGLADLDFRQASSFSRRGFVTSRRAGRKFT